jgi:hypothetical protein
MKAIQRLYRNQRGMSMLFVSLGMLGFIGASTLAIDVGMLMTARTQAQTSADSGALAGATALVYNDFTNRSQNGPAVTSAVNTALTNQVIAQPVSVRPGDVEFLNDPVTGQANMVKVTVYRTVARDNPVPTLMGRLIGINQADVQATATAQAGWANAEDCVLPFTIPDKWIEKQCPQTEICDPGTTYDPSDTFDMYDSKGNLIPNPDIYVPPDSKTATPTGFNPVTDRGMQIVLKDGTGQNSASSSWYNPWDINGNTGANYYSNSISGCNTTVLQPYDMMLPETGNMVGPTKQGVAALVAQDPNAYWDTSCQCVKGSAFNLSPRIRPVPLYDPTVFAAGKANGKSNPQLRVVGFLGFFIESINTNADITGRITPVLGKIILGGSQVTSGFAQVVMLVK